MATYSCVGYCMFSSHCALMQSLLSIPLSSAHYSASEIVRYYIVVTAPMYAPAPTYLRLHHCEHADNPDDDHPVGITAAFLAHHDGVTWRAIIR
ncbi:hypothetical protein EDB19DRAFT_614905, partial [Suillus lakei]